MGISISGKPLPSVGNEGASASVHRSLRHWQLLVMTSLMGGVLTTCGGDALPKPAQQPPQPERYGAKGDGRTDDFDAIVRCLREHGRCVLGPRTYVVREYIPIPDRGEIRGAGKNKTVVRLANNSVAAANASGSYLVVGNSFPKPSNNARIADLTIDCNFQGQRVPGKEQAVTMNAVMLWGTNNLIENVRATGFQVGKSGQECFVLFCALGAGQAVGRGSTIRRCEVTGVAPNPGIRYPGTPIVTCIANGGGQYFTTNAVIEECWIHDMTTEATQQQSHLQGLTSGAGRYLTIRNNTVNDFYGSAIYQDTWRSEDLMIVSNRLMNVRYGIYLMAPGGKDGATYDGVVISQNTIRLAADSLKYDEQRPYANQQRAINFYNQPAYKRVLISDNSIQGRSWSRGGKQYSPEGIALNVPPTNRTEFTLRNNQLNLAAPRR